MIDYLQCFARKFWYRSIRGDISMKNLVCENNDGIFVVDTWYKKDEEKKEAKISFEFFCFKRFFTSTVYKTFSWWSLSNLLACPSYPFISEIEGTIGEYIWRKLLASWLSSWFSYGTYHHDRLSTFYRKHKSENTIWKNVLMNVWYLCRKVS